MLPKIYQKNFFIREKLFLLYSLYEKKRKEVDFLKKNMIILFITTVCISLIGCGNKNIKEEKSNENKFQIEEQELNSVNPKVEKNMK